VFTVGNVLGDFYDSRRTHGNGGIILHSPGTHINLLAHLLFDIKIFEIY
jgi:hypothetical protein